MSRARERESSAWSELVDLYGPLVAHWCYRCGLDTHAAADCVQDTFASVVKSLVSFRGQRETGAFRAWLWTITANKIRDHQRRVRRDADPVGGSTALRSLEQLPDPSLVPDTEPTNPAQLDQLFARAVEQVRGEFETRTWEIFERSVIDLIQTAQVAREFQLSPAAVRQVRSRVLRRLRQQLGDIEL